MADSPLPLRLLPGAIEDARRTTEELAEESQELADRFEAELRRTLGFIIEFPFIYQEYKAGTRRALVRTFKDSIVYRVGKSEILIVAVARPRREPGYWINRDTTAS